MQRSWSYFHGHFRKPSQYPISRVLSPDSPGCLGGCSPVAIWQSGKIEYQYDRKLDSSLVVGWATELPPSTQDTSGRTEHQAEMFRLIPSFQWRHLAIIFRSLGREWNIKRYRLFCFNTLILWWTHQIGRNQGCSSMFMPEKHRIFKGFDSPSKLKPPSRSSPWSFTVLHDVIHGYEISHLENGGMSKMDRQ